MKVLRVSFKAPHAYEIFRSTRKMTRNSSRDPPHLKISAEYAGYKNFLEKIEDESTINVMVHEAQIGEDEAQLNRPIRKNKSSAGSRNSKNSLESEQLIIEEPNQDPSPYILFFLQSKIFANNHSISL